MIEKLRDQGIGVLITDHNVRETLPIIERVNKDAAADLDVELDFGRGISGAVQTEKLHAPALDSREAHITTSMKADSLQQGKCSVTVPHATGLRLTLN